MKTSTIFNYKNIKIMPQEALFIMIVTITIASLSTFQWSLVFLAGAFLIDFITGILASWNEYRNSDQKIKVYFIESNKLRKSLSKAITYMSVIAFVYFFEMIFFIKSFTFSFSNKELTVTLITIFACVVIEFFSILENSKRSGYDILGKIKEIAKNGWSIFNLIKTGKDK
jgi:hypothetical protein